MKTKSTLCLFIFLLSTACGSIQTVSQNTGTPDPNIAEAETITSYLFATDFASSGQILSGTSDMNGMTNTGLSGLGSSAVIRAYDNLLYLLADGFSIASYDNVQVIDPSKNFATTKQFSTGVGTNPHDIVVKNNRAFITLYSPDRNTDMINENGQPIDLLVMDLSNGATIKGFSFVNHLNADSNLNTRADQMVLVGNKLYVCLQDLDGSTFEHNTSGKIAVINSDNLELEKIITLKGRNPVDIVATADKLFIALQAPYDFSSGNFDTTLPYGGIEIVPLDGTDSTLLADETLGGYIERLAISSSQVFAVASNFDSTNFAFTSHLLAMPFSASNSDAAETFIENSSDVREIAINSLDQLWISRRAIKAGDGSASNPQVDVFDANTGESLGDAMIPPVPVTSIAFN